MSTPDRFDPFGDVEGAEAIPLEEAIAQFREFHGPKEVERQARLAEELFSGKSSPLRRKEQMAIQEKERERIELCLFRSIMASWDREGVAL